MFQRLIRLEVFVVIVVLCILMALVPPVLEHTREAARRAECSNQLEVVALALQKYHDTHAVFPMGAMHSGMNPGGDPPVTAGLGPAWWFGLLPLTDQRGGPKVVVTTGSKGMVYLVDTDAPMYDKILESQRPGQDVRCEFCADDIERYLHAHPYTVRDGPHVGQLTIGLMIPDYMRCPSSPAPHGEQCLGAITLPSYVGIAGGCDIAPES